MIELCPNFEKCCTNGINYKEIVEEICSVPKFLCDFSRSLCDIYYDIYHRCKNTTLMIKKYIFNNLEKFSDDEFYFVFQISCKIVNIEEIKELLKFSIIHPQIKYSYHECLFSMVCSELCMRDGEENTCGGDEEYDEGRDQYTELELKKMEIIKMVLDYSVGYPFIINRFSNFSDIFGGEPRPNIKLAKLILDFSIKYPILLNPSTNNSKILIDACSNEYGGNHEIIKLLFEYAVDPRVVNDNKLNIGISSKKALKLLFDLGYEKAKTLKLFLDYCVKYPDVLIINAMNNILKYVWNSDNVEVPKLFLDYSIEYPEIISFNVGEAFVTVCKKNNLKTIKLFLDYSIKYPKMMNLNYNNNEAFFECINCVYYGYEKTQLLLEHSINYPSNEQSSFKQSLNTINPSARNSEALHFLMITNNCNHNYNIIKLLLEYSRRSHTWKIDIHARNDEALTVARKENNGVEELLLQYC
jgi:hypothetical protein